MLADILIQYITEVCHSSQSYARHAGRSEFNILDVLLSLDDIGQPLDELRTYIKSLVRQQSLHPHATAPTWCHNPPLIRFIDSQCPHRLPCP